LPHGSDYRPITALALRLLAVFCLASMAALIKLAEMRGVHVLELMFFRQAFSVPVVLAWVLSRAGLASLATRRLGAHISRTLVGLIGMVSTFSAIILLPLAEATTLQFTVPLFATLLSVLLLRERPGIYRWSAVLVGFVGILVVVQPGRELFPLVGALVGLLAALMIALISILLRQLGATEPAARTVFWFSTLSLIPLAPPLLFVGQSHDPVEWLLLAGIGVIGGIGQIALTAALRWAPVSLVVVMDYSSLIWAAAYGWLLFGSVPAAATWIGAPLIIGSGFVIVWREHYLLRQRRSPDTVETAKSNG
jgi:drug/metabolite transporter (DMT)-like permease